MRDPARISICQFQVLKSFDIQKSRNFKHYISFLQLYSSLFPNYILGSIWPTGFGRICGINPDQHFYVHISREENFKHIDISITTVRINKSYKFGKC